MNNRIKLHSDKITNVYNVPKTYFEFIIVIIVYYYLRYGPLLTLRGILKPIYG